MKAIYLEIGVSQKTVGDLFHLFRTIICEGLQRKSMKLGGEGHIVEIDENYFRHSAKYRRRRRRREVNKEILGVLIDWQKRGV